MTTLRQKIEEELNSLDSESMAAVYEQLRRMSRLRNSSSNTVSTTTPPHIKKIHELTAESGANWADDVRIERDERL